MVSSPFREALRDAPREGWLDRLAAASLEAAEAKFGPAEPHPLLTVELQASEVDTWDTARVALAVQNATAKLGHLISDPKTNSAQSRRSYREAAPLIPRGQAGRTLFFGFPTATTGELHDPLFDMRVSTLPERAVVDLVGLLPKGPEDYRALDAVLARRVTERSAINDLVRAVQETDSGVTVSFRDHTGKTAASVLLQDQAATLEDALRETSIDRREITLTGSLDGMRTQRRIFYLLGDDGREISGGVDTELLTEVREHIGDTVVATVEEVTSVEQSGKRSRPSYRLLRLTRPASLFE